MIVNLLTEHHLEFLSLTGGYRGSSESTLVKMSNCWESHVTAHLYFLGGAQTTILSGPAHVWDMVLNERVVG